MILLQLQRRDQDGELETVKVESETVDCKETFELALAAMKRVTEMVNEGKSTLETISYHRLKLFSYRQTSQ